MIAFPPSGVAPKSELELSGGYKCAYLMGLATADSMRAEYMTKPRHWHISSEQKLSS
jgi:hypothetical protein